MVFVFSVSSVPLWLALHSVFVPIPVAELFHEPPFLLGQGGHALRRDFFQQLVHAAFFRLLALRFALGLLLGALLPPALKPALLGRRRRGGRAVFALQARVALREVVAEQRIVGAQFQDRPLVHARKPDKEGQAQRQDFLVNDGVQADD